MTKQITKKVFHLTSGRLIARNTMINTAGQILTLIVAFIAMPFLTKGFGLERFGVLTLSWVIIGYFGFFDLKLGRALTQKVSEKLSNGQKEEVPELFWTSSLLLLILGVIAAFIGMVFSQAIIYNFLNISEHLIQESLYSFYMLSLILPFITMTSGFVGFLEALQRFDLINIVRAPLGIFTYTSPLIVLIFTNNLFFVILVLIGGRIAACIAYLLFCMMSMPIIKTKIRFDQLLIKPLLSYGGWITVSAMMSPIMEKIDRFLIGFYLPVSYVSFYAVSHEIVNRLLIFPTAFMSVLFPVFAAGFTKDSFNAANLLSKGIRVVIITVLPIAFILNLFGYEILNIWIGREFAENGSIALQWLAIGLFMNSIARIPFVMIQGSNRPDLTAKLHIFELPVYLITVVYLIKFKGIEGAAIAWVLRVGLDAIILLVMAYKIAPESLRTVRKIIYTIIFIPFLFYSCSYINYPAHKLTVFILFVTIFIILTWRHILIPEEKSFMMDSFLKTKELIEDLILKRNSL